MKFQLPHRPSARTRGGARLAFLVALAAIGLTAPRTPAQDKSQDGAWTLLPEFPKPVAEGEAWVRAEQFRALALDEKAMRGVLAQAPLEDAPDAPNPLVFELPRPDGTTALFHVWESPIMEAGLAAQFPLIRTYVGQGLDRPTETLRMDITPEGFHAQVLSHEGRWLIDPCTRGDFVHHSSYFARDYAAQRDFACHTEHGDEPAPTTPFASRASTGPTRRTYRLACAATGEYTAYHGSQAAAQSAIVTLVNRVTGVYETELAVRMTLVANNIDVVYPTAAGDPFTSAGNASTTNAQLQTTLDSVIGAANYDIGHIVHNGTNNGLAGGIGVVCIAGTKGQGYTSVTPPIGDVLAIDYVAHEMGHQFGGRHTFNSCEGSQGDSSTIAHEPGSGSTIMGYAGICTFDNLQPNSDPYFASINQDQISAYTAGTTCDVETATGNLAPSVAGGPDYTIPASTPFTLTATGSDPNSNPLTYSWEQRNGGAAVLLTAFADNGSSPIARVWNPTSSPSRTIPRPSNLITNSFAVGEILPTTSRTLAFRVVGRDNVAGAGGVNFDDVSITVNNAAGPFRVTAPSGSVSWPGSSSQTITWNVASTNAAPINCANVAIDWSTDGGNTWPTTLVVSTPNDGSHTITVPNTTTTLGRIRVRAINNIFFNINQGPTAGVASYITVTPAIPGVSLAATGVNAFTDTTGNGNSNTRIDPGESDIRVTVELTNSGLTTATGISATLTSLTATATVLEGSSNYANIANSATAINAPTFGVSVLPSHPCGNPINLRLVATPANGPQLTYDFSFPTGLLGGSGSPQTFNYAGAPVNIPDNNLTGVTATITVSGVVGTITDVDFAFLGSSCNATAGSTTVGLSHTYLADLDMTLTSPAGTVIDFCSDNGGGGNNMCNTVFDDAAAASITSILSTGAPWSGTYRPEVAFSAFNGQNPNGVWTLRVADDISSDLGTIRAFRVTIRGQSATTCDPPIVVGCDSIDFNGDGIFPDNQDFIDFLAVFSGGSCPTGACGDIDFNNDGVFPDNQDVSDLLGVFAGQSC
jgi:subtilisin-like proprotein convertase family protein